MKTKKVDGPILRRMIISAANNLVNNKDVVDKLNVFPVPDGDTGTNMSLTLLAASREVENIHDESISVVADALAAASLKGARGNSGVILSQLFRGFARKVKNCQSVDVRLFAEALQAGVDTAYKAVMKPTEGTILTVAREGAKKAVDNSQICEDIAEVFDNSIEHAKTILDKTPEMLPVLKKAGVVDAGGKGLIYILEGALEVIKHDEVIELIDTVRQSQVAQKVNQEVLQHIKFVYCTEFLIYKNSTSHYNNASDWFKKKIGGEGDSMLVIDDDELIKVHIHTNNPGIVIQHALKIGELNNIKIDNMAQQHNHIINKDKQMSNANVEMKEYGFVAVAAGEGIMNILKDLGVDRIIEGGQTMNPSTSDILDAVDNVQAKNIIVFPNNKNIILAAKQVKELTTKNVIIIPSQSIPQGIAALLAFDSGVSADDNYESMVQAIETVVTGNVTYAVRDCVVNDNEVEQGDILGIINGEIYAAGKSVEAVCRELLDGMVKEDSEIITIFYGNEVGEQSALELDDYIQDRYPDCDVEVHCGGQPLYYYIISVE